MLKRFVLLFSFLLIPAISSAQYTTLSCGSPQYGWNAASPTNGTSSTGYALQPNLLFVTWQLGYSSAPSSVTMTLEGSNDNSLWSALGTSTSTSGQIQNTATAVRFIRVTQTARSGGSGVTLIFNCVQARSGGGGSTTDYTFVEDEGSVLPSRATINMIGAGVTCVDNVTKTDCTFSGGSGGYATVEDEGSGLTQRTTVNFVGAGVSCADSGGKTVCTISGTTFPLVASVGSQSAPSYTFSGDTDTGIFWSGPDEVTFTGGGAIIGALRGTVGGGLIKGLVLSAAGSGIMLEGSTNNGTYTTLTVADPTTARSITFPDASGTVALEPSGNGIFVRTAAGSVINRSVTSAAGTLIITNADGVAGNINLDVDTSTLTMKGSGTADHPAACGEVGVDVFQVGDVYLETDEGRADFCVNLDTWASAFSGALPVSSGGTGLTSGTSGGILAFTGATTLASSGALTANLPVIGGGAGVAPTVGTRTGNTTLFVTSTGTQTSGRCVEIDANGNHIAAAAACGTGSGTDSYQYLDSNLTSVGNVGTGDDTLHTTTISAGKLAANGDYAIMKTTGQFTASANNKRIRAKFGATTIFDTGALVITAATDWTLTCTITRTGATTQRSGCFLNSSSSVLNAFAQYATPAETLSGTVAFLVSGEATSNDDVVARVTNWDFVSSVGTSPTPINLATSVTGTLPVANGGTGATTLTGLLQGNGTSAITAITNSTTVGQVLRVTGSNTYAWGALDLADSDAVTGALPIANGGTASTSIGNFLRNYPHILHEFSLCGATGTNHEGLQYAAIATGTCASNADSGAHPFTIQLTSSGSANSGWLVRTTTAALVLGGGESIRTGFLINTLSTLTYRFGFADATSSTAPVDGCYIEVVSTGVATGICANNSTTTSTGTTTTLSTSTWYSGEVLLNSDASVATFTIYDASGSQIWTNTVSSNIPTTSARATGYEAIATQGTGGTTALVTLDYMIYYSTKSLAR